LIIEVELHYRKVSSHFCLTPAISRGKRMSFNPNNTNTLNQQFEGLSLKSESKYDEDTLDEAIINGLKGEYKEFCKNIEQFLNQFMKGPKYFSDLFNPKQDRTNEVIPDLNKYQRKIVHKICDLYCITRDVNKEFCWHNPNFKVC